VILHPRTSSQITLHNDHRSPGPATRIARAVGDTAGHAYPALADAFRERDPNARMLFRGKADSIAARILTRDEGRSVYASVLTRGQRVPIDRRFLL